MTRGVPEWIGKTDDTPVPPHVRLRIFKDRGGICHIAKRKIMRGDLWDLDHVVALCNGGENRESNLAPALRDKHREKTKADVAEKSRVYRKHAKFIGVELRKGPKLQGRPFEKRAPQRTATRPIERRT